MAQNHDDQNTIRQYLLKGLDEDQQQRIEKRLLTEDDLFEELEIAEDELIDEYLAEKLSEDERERFEQNFLRTPHRNQKLRFARALRRHLSTVTPQANVIKPAKFSSLKLGRQPFFASPLALAAVLLIIAGIGFAVWRGFIYQSDVDKGLIALNSAYREQRPFEARMTQLDYAPFVTTRGPGTSTVNESELRRAELTLLEALNKNPTPEVHHALGKVYLAKKDFDRAIEQFDEALKGDPRNAKLNSDLGAAYLEKAKIDLGRGRANPNSSESGKGMEDLARSLEPLNRALELNPNLPEALFNRALVYQEMVLPQQAEEDWKKYLEKDPNSKWADEARRHLNELEERKKARTQNKADLLPEFVAAYESNSDDKAYELISKNTEAIAGQLVWWQLAGAYLDAASKRETDRAGSYLQALAYAGRLQEKKAGDRFVSELAGFYKSTSFERQAALAKAHAMIDAAHLLMAKSEAAEALKLYQTAKAVFDKEGDQWESLFAVYWIGYCQYRKSEFKEALSSLSQVAQYSKAKSYLWPREKALTMIANIHLESSQFSQSIEYCHQSLEISKKINDVYNIQKNLAVLAYAYRNLGNRQESLTYTHKGLESAEACWPGARQMYRNYYAAGGVLNAFGYFAAAAEYEKAALQLALEEADPLLEHQSHVHLAAIYTKLRDYAEAFRHAMLSHQAAKSVDERIGRRPVADSSLQSGHINRQTGNYDKAITYYDEAVRLYGGMKLFAFLYEAHKGRLLDYIAQGDDLLAKEELQIVLALFEEHRSKIREEKNRNSFFDLEQNIYDIAIGFEYSRTHNYQKAYEYSEVSRARSLLDLMNTGAEVADDDNPDIVISSVAQPLTLGGIRDRMPEQVQILQYAVLDDKVLAWVISKDKFGVAEQKITSSSLTGKVVNYLKSVSNISASETEESRRAGIELYEILIKPVEPLLEKNKQIYIVPDKALNSLPFNALLSPITGKYLINDYLLSFAPSSSIFVASSEAARQRSVRKDERVLSVGDPHFDRGAFPELPDLPASGKEAEQVADYYKSSCLLVGDQAKEERVRSEMDRADVIHIASHYVIDEHNPMLSKLLLTRGAMGVVSREASDGILQAYEICKRKLPITRLVALSACRTGVERYYSGEGMIGISRTFLAAGVPLVAASLWPVASDPTANLMTSFHRYRKHSDLSTAEALRQAQLDMLNNRQHPYDEPYYWAPFVLIGGYANF